MIMSVIPGSAQAAESDREYVLSRAADHPAGADGRAPAARSTATVSG